MIRIEALQFRDPRRLLAVLLCAALLAFTSRAGAQDRYQLLHEFTGDTSPSAEGARPAAPLVEASDGYLYGTTTAGGSLNRGTVFRMSRTGVVSVLHEFVGGAGDGAYPTSLVQATDGNLYGLTQGGGPQDRGTIFRLSPAGAFAMVYSFTGGADGSNPLQLIQASDGFLYGIAGNDGPFGMGTMFRLDPPGTPTLVHAFGSSPSDGQFPTALMQARDGSFYGFTLTNYSTAFRMLPDGTYIPLHTFDPGSEGYMVRTLVEGQDGNFFGATSCFGTIFRMTPGGEVAVLSRQDNLNCDRVHAPFDNVSISLVPVPDGSFYGVRHRLRDSHPNPGSGTPPVWRRSGDRVRISVTTSAINSRHPASSSTCGDWRRVPINSSSSRTTR